MCEQENVSPHYNGARAAKTAETLATGSPDEITCPGDLKCTCAASCAVNAGFDDPFLYDDSTYRAAPFIDELDNRYSARYYYNPQDKNPDGSPKAFDAPGEEYDGFAYYGEIGDEETWSIFVNSIMPDLKPGDIIGYHNMNDNSEFNHVATVVGFAMNPDQGNAMWPLVVDVSGSVAEQPHFLDASSSLDIHEVIVIFVGR